MTVINSAPDYEEYDEVNHNGHPDTDTGTYEIIIDGMGETSRDGEQRIPPPASPGPGNMLNETFNNYLQEKYFS